MGRRSLGHLDRGFRRGCPCSFPADSSSSIVEKKPHCSGCCLLAVLQGCSAGAVSCPALALSISSPCHVPSVFSPALRFLCLMSHLYILQVVCLAFISPISAFLEGWRGGLVAAVFPYCRLPASLRSRHQTAQTAGPNSPRWFWHFMNPHGCRRHLQSTSAPQHPHQPTPWGRLFFLPAPSPGGNQCGAERGPITWDTP